MVKTSFDKGIIIPILLGCFSIAGLCIVLFFGQLNNSRPVVQANDTATLSDYIFIGTEPAIFAPTLEETEAPALTEPTAMGEIRVHHNLRLMVLPWSWYSTHAPTLINTSTLSRHL
jgi:hypothetical protein